MYYTVKIMKHHTNVPNFMFYCGTENTEYVNTIP